MAEIVVVAGLGPFSAIFGLWYIRTAQANTPVNEAEASTFKLRMISRICLIPSLRTRRQCIF